MPYSIIEEDLSLKGTAMRKERSKRKHLKLLLFILCLGLCVSGTLAYITVSNIVRNVITTGSLRVEVIETDADGNPFKNVSGVLPGMKVGKVVTVKNTADNPCWVRINVRKEIILDEGITGTPDLSLIELDLDTEDWVEQDGSYYYNRKLESGESTVPLFTTVVFNGDIADRMYTNCTANVTVGAEAVQCANNGNTVLEAEGWPEK